jgi:hypothetical protein
MKSDKILMAFDLSYANSFIDENQDTMEKIDKIRYINFNG